MIYLLGVDHQVQHRRDAREAMIFSRYVSRKIKDLNIQFVAEEWSSDSSKISHVKTTITKDIADKHKLPHEYCDPTTKERNQIGWLSKKDDSLREKFWFDRIKQYISRNMIFVCGADHLESFGKLISENGYKYEILSKRFDIISYNLQK